MRSVYRRLGVVLLVLTLVAGCGRSSATEPAPPRASGEPSPLPTVSATTGPEATPAPGAVSAEPTESGGTFGSDWELLRSADGNFLIRMPEQPEESTQPVPTDVGTLEMTVFQVSQGAKVYIVIYGDYPEEVIASGDPDQILDGAVQGQLTNVSGTLEEQTAIDLAGFPGRAAKLVVRQDGREATIYNRIYLVNNRLYQTMVLMETDKLDREAVNFFLDSFELLEIPEKTTGGGG